MPEPLTITLSPELSEKIRTEAASHGYATETEFVEHHMAESLGPDSEFESWLQSEVSPAIEELNRDPSKILTAEQVRANMLHTRETFRKAN